ncbi:MAG: HTTM domain-containing protein [Bacteroidia bacterium]
MLSKLKSYNQHFFDRVDPLRFDAFRIVFALALMLQFSSYIKFGFIEKGILAPAFTFHFHFFPFIKPLPAAGLKFALFLTLIGPMLMLFRKTLRTGATIYFISFGYLFLLEESYYNNHFYLILILTAFYILFSQKGSTKNNRFVFKWQHDLFVFMICIVYFFGGLVKLNHDWFLLQQPTRTLLEMNSEAAPFPNLLKSEFAVYYITYGGLFFDLLIPFLLLLRRTFPYALVLTLIFHITNIFIFNIGEGGNIGVFPIMMMGANILFAPQVGFRKLLARFIPGVEPVYKTNDKSPDLPVPHNAKLIRIVVYSFVALQLLLPARPNVISNRASWTGQGDFFAWRMKLNNKQVQVAYYFQESRDSPRQKINIGRIINTMQINCLGQHADMVYKFAMYLDERMRKETGKDMIITADILVSLNGREPALLVDSTTDLSRVSYSPFVDPEWVLPAPE